MTVALSLLAAVSYGIGDFIGGVTSRRASPWTVALVAMLTGGLLSLGLSLLTGGTLTTADWGWSVLAGVGNGLGTSFLYRGFSGGRMAVVGPISAVGAAVLPVAVGLGLGERPSLVVWLGLVAAFPGIWLVSREPSDPAGGARVGLARGVADGIMAGLGFGTVFAGLAQVEATAGFWPLAINQLVAAVTIPVLASLFGASWQPGSTTALLGVLPGLAGAVATGSFMLASQGGLLTIAAVVTSLYPAITVLLAALLLHEVIHRGQAAGLLCCAVAVTLVATGDA